ncbi:MAG: hypothetical protein IJ365_02080 [Clostridia bacterium]|nr:hypothetical protein [Clostridia bacterium]
MPLYAICPFFLYEKKTVIGCELKTLKFSTYDAKKQWMINQCCCFDYAYCIHAEKLFRKYNEDNL